MRARDRPVYGLRFMVMGILNQEMVAGIYVLVYGAVCARKVSQ